MLSILLMSAWDAGKMNLEKPWHTASLTRITGITGQARAWTSLVVYLLANAHENERPNSSAPPIRTAARKAEAYHFFIPAFVTRSL